MKKGTHPTYRKVAFKDSNTGDLFIIGSTIHTERTVSIDKQNYPMVVMDVTSASHPFYTGKQKSHQQEGRIARFNKKYGI